MLYFFHAPVAYNCLTAAAYYVMKAYLGVLYCTILSSHGLEIVWATSSLFPRIQLLRGSICVGALYLQKRSSARLLAMVIEWSPMERLLVVVKLLWRQK
jgi:hypothetical protein